MEGRQMIDVKEWFINKAQDTARRYNTYIDVYSRDENGTVEAKDGYLTVQVLEVLKETEKAIQAVLSTGEIVGSVKGWKTWIPKSVIK